MNSADYDNFQNEDPDDEDEEESDENDESEEDEREEEPVDISQMYVYSKENLENKNEDENPAKKRKTLVIEANKPAHMEIKQLNLDEIKELEEIPIENKNNGHVSDEENEKPARTRTVKVEQDPFFLDKDGREIVGESGDSYNSNRYNGYKNRNYDDQDSFNDNYDDKRNFNNRKFQLQNSSFKNSLSSSRHGDGYQQNNYARRGGFGARGGYNNSGRSDNRSQSRQGDFNNDRSGNFGAQKTTSKL
jgi:hypothetical protein